jgi:glycosyltransferase involved in cell wall biosynthesis
MPDLLVRLKKLDVPIITTIHTTIKGQREGTRAFGSSFWDLEFSEKMTSITYPFLRLAENLYFAKGHYYITPSDYMKEYILENYLKLKGKNIFVIPHGIDTRLFSPSNKLEEYQGKDIVLFVGRLLALKNVHLIVKAAPLILKEHPRTLFLFIGPGNNHPYIEEFKKMKIPGDSYLFLGHKNRESLAKYYSSADAYVLPSSCENFPFAPLEAMACSVPPIVSKVGGLPEIVDNNVNGILIDPGSVEDIANSVIYLLDNPDIREKMGKEARETVERKFSWQTAASKTISVYKLVIDQTSTRIKGC